MNDCGKRTDFSVATRMRRSLLRMNGNGKGPVARTDDKTGPARTIDNGHPASRERRAQHDRTQRNKPGKRAQADGHNFPLVGLCQTDAIFIRQQVA
jgi:hypothetical protein